MGFALSRFSTFQNIVAQDSYVLGKMAQFRLCAIVLHRPNQREFAEYLSGNMERLNVETGERFLFIALTQPPKKWKHKINPNPKYQFEAFDSNGTNDIYNEQLLTSFLQQIGLGHVQLPGILLTNNLDSKKCFYFSTSQDQLSDQLIALGDYCTHQDDQISLIGNNDLRALIEEISGDNYDVRTNTKSIAEILSGLTACEEIHSPHFLNKVTAETVVQTHIKQFESAIRSVQRCAATNPDYIPDLQKWVNLNNYIATIFSADSNQETDNLAPLIIRDEELMSAGIERGTEPWQYSQAYNLLLQMKNKFPSAILRELSGILHPLTNLNLVMFLEHEVNASIIQLIREERGIFMPEYYWKYDAERGQMICKIPYTDWRGNTTIHNVNLNAYRNGNRGNLATITLGQAREVWELENSKYNTDIPVEYCDYLLAFNKLREAHAGRIQSDENETDIIDTNRIFKEYLQTCQPKLSHLADILKQ